MAFAEQALLLPSMGPKSRFAAVQGFKQLFKTGQIVELARASERAIGR